MSSSDLGEVELLQLIDRDGDHQRAGLPVRDGVDPPNELGGGQVADRESLSGLSHRDHPEAPQQFRAGDVAAAELQGEGDTVTFWVRGRLIFLLMYAKIRCFN